MFNSFMDACIHMQMSEIYFLGGCNRSHIIVSFPQVHTGTPLPLDGKKQSIDPIQS